MSWHKEGRIFSPEQHRYTEELSHAAVPFADHLEGNRYRIYFSPRDKQNRSQVSYLELSIDKPTEILKVSKAPVLQSGEPGTFDDAGAMCSWIVNNENEKWMYYIGWNLSVNVPFRNALGLAISRDNGNTFERISSGPILDRSIYDPAFVASACVLVDENIWRMWYLSGIEWIRHKNGDYQHKYNIKYAESLNGIDWNRSGVVCIDFENPNEYAISRPTVIKDHGIYRMWYSYRGDTYRIGYAESRNGIDWIRKDSSVGIDVSPTGWDSQMIEYPHVVKYEDTLIMFYNGNNYGKTGVGMAKFGTE